MIEINLMPDVKQELIKAQQVRAKVIAVSVAIGVISISVVALLAAYIFAVQSVRSSMADTAIENGSDSLNSVEDLSKTLTIQNQLTKIAALNDDKKISSRIFDVLNAIIPPAPNSVQISNLSVDTDLQTITIEGQAPNSYAAVEVFKKTIAGAQLRFTDSYNEKQELPLASNISTSNTSYGEDSSGNKVLRFTLSFNYITELFAPASKNISIAISINGNVTDSYLGVPQSIFVQRATDLTEGQ
ncbi:MAG: hypothetical protein WCI79_01505 [Candidatus Saccharibacteria bacterium]